jgi:hypothetical protein
LPERDSLLDKPFLWKRSTLDQPSPNGKIGKVPAMQGSSTQIASTSDDVDARIEGDLDVKGHNERSVYNVAGYKPVKTELSRVPMRVTAKIPDDRTGVYLRNGTNTQFDKTHVRIHAFVGAGMLHQIQIRNGAATYSNTYIRTPRFLAEEAIGREAYSGITDVIGGGKTTLLIG